MEIDLPDAPDPALAPITHDEAQKILRTVQIKATIVYHNRPVTGSMFLGPIIDAIKKCLKKEATGEEILANILGKLRDIEKENNLDDTISTYMQTLMGGDVNAPSHPDDDMELDQPSGNVAAERTEPSKNQLLSTLPPHPPSTPNLPFPKRTLQPITATL